MIDSVKIGVLTYAIELAAAGSKDGVLHNPDGKVLGEVFYGDAKIYIEDEQHPDAKRTTLVHEILHAILRQTGHFDANNDEGLVNGLAFALVALLRDNPALVAYLVGDAQAVTVSANGAR